VTSGFQDPQGYESLGSRGLDAAVRGFEETVMN